MKFAPAHGDAYAGSSWSEGMCFATTVILKAGNASASRSAVVRPVTPALHGIGQLRSFIEGKVESERTHPITTTLILLLDAIVIIRVGLTVRKVY
jgi:hypothetical protein